MTRLTESDIEDLSRSHAGAWERETSYPNS
jgi:hypothetical protein